jgi:hypothetical protein
MRTGVVVLSSCADFYEQIMRQVIPAVGLAEFSRVDTIEAAMQRFSPSDRSDCGVCILHGDDKKIK